VKLPEKQKRFCKAYIGCKFNGTQAAIKAGYSAKTAEVAASRLLRNVKIRAFIAELIAKDEKKIGLDFSKERTLLEMGRLAFSDIRKFYNEDGSLKPIHELDDDAAAALSGFEVEEMMFGDIAVAKVKKIKRWDKTKALEMYAKYHKIYTDAPVNNNFNVPFTEDQVDKIISSLRENKTT
jgi:phage terminase small subunit